MNKSRLLGIARGYVITLMLMLSAQAHATILTYTFTADGSVVQDDFNLFSTSTPTVTGTFTYDTTTSIVPGTGSLPCCAGYDYSFVEIRVEGFTLSVPQRITIQNDNFGQDRFTIQAGADTDEKPSGVDFGSVIIQLFGPTDLWNTTALPDPLPSLASFTFTTSESNNIRYEAENPVCFEDPRLCGPGEEFLTSQVNFTITQLSQVPVPAAVWLFGTGLIGLVGMARRKKAA